jgi:hypothetical protein
MLLIQSLFKVEEISLKEEFGMPNKILKKGLVAEIYDFLFYVP